MDRRGYTLVEAILASFLLVGTFTMVSRLFQKGLQYSGVVENRLLAVRLADERMAEVRRWAKTTRNWQGFPNGPNPAYPAFDISVDVSEEYALYSPSKELEKAYPSSDRREMNRLARKAKVRVRWGLSSSYLLTAIVHRAPKAWRRTDPLVVAGGSAGPITENDSVRFTVEGYDEDGQLIPNLFYHWSVVPNYLNDKPANGRIILVSRDGRAVDFKNKLRQRDGSEISMTGHCRVVVYARYNGILAEGQSDVLQLVAP
jgi:hypothetical protein